MGARFDQRRLLVASLLGFALLSLSATWVESINALVSDKEWLVGDTLSIADIAVVSMCTVLDRAVEARSLMDSMPALRDWQQRVDALTLPETGDKAMV